MDRGTLNLYQLRLLTNVVSHGTISGAAQSLGLTQPAVSAQIRHLQRYAGAPVLIREGRRVVLTEAGRALYRYAEETLGAADALNRDLEDITAGERDHIVVVGPLAYVAYVLPAPLAEYQLQHPNLQISVSEALSGDIVERIRSGRADIGIAFSSRIPTDLADALVVSDLFDDQMVVIESTKRPFRQGEPVSFQELAGIPVVSMSRGGAGSEASLNQLLAGAGVEPLKSAIRFTTWAGVIGAVASGLGVAAVLRSVIQDHVARGNIRVLEIEGWRQVLRAQLICSPDRRSKHLSRVFEELLSHLQTELPRIVGWPDSTSS